VYRMLSCFMKHSLLILAIFAVIGSLRSEAQSLPVYRTDQEVSEDLCCRRGRRNCIRRVSLCPYSAVKER